MMKRIPVLLVIILSSQSLFAQFGRGGRNAAVAAPPLPLREVSGIVKDSTDSPIVGAIITLMSKSDTIRSATNVDGIFVLKNVKEAVFVLTISEIGYQTSTRKYLQNDAVKKVVLDPIVLKPQNNVLAEVKVNGTPSITYKTDTVEYKASDYKVRENATVDELLKKMEGMEVGSDGSLTHQGQKVTKAKLNGKDYAGGNVAQAIQNLPADIVEKIQIVDDYGDEAARTGVKDGDPQKILNITTRVDRSVGNIARLTAGEGSDSRYDDRVFLQRINANQQIGLIGNLRNTVNGVASTGINSGSGGTFGSQSSSSGSGGTTKSGGPAFNYRDQWGKKIQVNASYTYGFTNVNSINNTSGQQYSTLGTTYFNNQNSGYSNSKTHTFSFDMEYSIDSANFLKLTPTYSYSGSSSDRNSAQVDSGVIHQSIFGDNSSSTTAPAYGMTAFYQHLFKKPRRNISLQLSYNHSDQQTTSEQNNNILYYQDSVSLTTPFLDSLVHRVIQRGSLTRNYRASLTYVEPLNLLSQLEFNAQYIYRGYNNNATSDNIVDSLNNLHVPIDSLDNIYQYSFSEARIALNYRLNKPKYNLSIGVTAIPTLLQGSRQGIEASVRHTDFNLIPIFRYSYSWSKTERFTINYTGTPTEPTFNQLQPFTDLTNPQNPVIGNPDLKPSFTNTINTQFNDYVANSQLNLSANVAASFINNQATTNNILVPVFVNKDGKTTQSYITETHFVNLNGSYNINGNYNIAKQYDDRKYNLELNGNVSYGYNVAMTNDIENFSTTWRYNERFGPRIDPNDWLEVNPYVSYDVTTSTNTLSAYNTNTKTVALSMDGKMYFLKTFLFGYSASKNFVSGISSNLTKNPFVVNATVEKEFFKRHNGILSIQIFDLFAQNNFVNRVITPTGFTDTKTNALSRYVMVSFRLNLQKWSGSPKRNGRGLKRRGDGSFIY